MYIYLSYSLYTYEYNFHMKELIMKVKVYLTKGYKIVNISVTDDVRTIANKYNRWEYVL